MDLDKLIKRFINGEESVFDELYARTRISVYYAAFSILKDKDLAEDVMQNTYIRVMRNIRHYTLGTNARAWIVKIAKNEALNLKKAREREISVDESENYSVYGTSESDRFGELIDLAKRILPDDEFYILMLVSAYGYKRREIGKILEMPIPTVTWKYNNALKKMRSALESEI